MKPTLYNALSRGMIVAASGWLLAACAPRADGPMAPTLRSAAFTRQAAPAKSAAPRKTATPPDGTTSEPNLSKTTYRKGDVLGGGYLADRSQVDVPAGRAIVTERFTLSMPPLGFSLFSITHFSGYLVSMS